MVRKNNNAGMDEEELLDLSYSVTITGTLIFIITLILTRILMSIWSISIPILILIKNLLV